MASRRRYGTKNAPIEIIDSDDETNSLDGALHVIDLTEDNEPIFVTTQQFLQRPSVLRSLPVRKASTASPLGEGKTTSASIRPSTPIQQASPKRNASSHSTPGGEADLHSGTPHVSHAPSERSPSDHAFLRVETPLSRRTLPIPQKQVEKCTSRSSTQGQDYRSSQILPNSAETIAFQSSRLELQTSPASTPNPSSFKEYDRLSAYNTPPQDKLTLEDQSLSKVDDESPISRIRRVSRFGRKSYLRGRMGVFPSLNNSVAVSKNVGRRKSPRLVVAEAQSTLSGKNQ